jgi:hypothetical protein
VTQTSDPVADVARAAASRLAPLTAPSLPADVEVALHARSGNKPPDRYIDPVSLGALVVSIASLAWTVYTDLKARTPYPSTEVVARTVRVQLHDIGDIDAATRDRIIEVIVSEAARAGGPTA